MMDMRVNLGGIELPNPVMPASGTFGEGMASVIDMGRLGAFVTKTITEKERLGNPLPRVAEFPGGMLNSIGIPSRGVEHFLHHHLPFYQQWDVPLVVSISASSVENFGRLAEQVTRSGVAAIEANISCPNLEQDGKAFGMYPDTTMQVVKEIRSRSHLPLWVKLTPNASDLTTIACAAEEGGAGALVVANTILAMSINIHTFRPSLGSTMGGLSGPMVKPIILRQVYQCAQCVNIPIIACGGITETADAIEYMLAGASALQVGTANFLNTSTMSDIIFGLDKFCKNRGIQQLSDIIGACRQYCEAQPD
ncbi:dihydroorotate dehydrogenase [Komagataeibacter oboediens]|uniref:Dihydroorotate dehydrogenase n=1 Tax=Komagataeibacter oboediens TaxID=65958 RepID=A0ABS5SN40_9PROT|nr:dihydroorotate dehydrogenase [Komagataeibacter oboediens]MBL7234834.1 dihydroorotate dehydrogenase [Komagataeibacter oboediens]MBT0675604.1 dihydroorotate dehydrogenase [Komagataeibacter oboediens]MBT0679097.1 dihydroorotate dehydrogenase [Komagataeibacter oboediens]